MTRQEVARRYEYPWPWQRQELVEKHAVEPDVDLRELADWWDCSYKLLAHWVRKHSYRTEDYRAVR